jgi:hypothetical protein
MTTQIDVIELTNGSVINQEWLGTGVFDTLMAAVNKNIELQYSKGRITGNDYSTVYLGAMQAVLGQSIEFLLRRDLTEVQIDDARKGIELKDAQLVGLGIDNQLKGLQVQLTAVEIAAKTYEKDVLLLDQHNKTIADISNAERQLVQSELTAAAQRLDISKGIEVKDAQIGNMEDDNLTAAKQREVLEVERQAKLYDVTNTLPANLAQIKKQTEVTERKMVEDELTAAKQREVSDKDIQVKEEQRKGLYAERVVKDKTAASLGLDNVVKQSEASRVDPTFVYSPRYNEV